MGRHELDARLKQVRSEISSIRAELAEQERKRSGREARANLQRDAEKRQLSTWWGRSKYFLGFKDKDAKGDLLGDGIDIVFGTLLLPLNVAMMQQLKDLELEEGRILDQLDSH